MADTIRVNLANPAELHDIGMSESDVEVILRYRREHGPITDERQLGSLLGGRPMPPGAAGRLDFSPADPTAPEAPGA